MAGTLFTLMWKHFTVRKRRFIHTPAELASPILYFLILFLFREQINPQPKHAKLTETNIHNTETFPLASGFTRNRVIMYTPDTNFTRTLMDSVGKKLNLSRLNSFSGMVTKGYYGFTNTSELLDFSSNLEKNEAIVVFQDYGEKSPGKLNYTIRMKEDFMTHIYESLDDNIGPHQRFGEIYAPFMQLQWAIDSSYIELKSGKPLPLTVYTQEFPYAESQQNSMASIICEILQPICWVALVLPFVFLATRLMEERTTGVQELIKMVGVSSNVLSLSHLLNAAPTGLVFSVGGALLLSVSSAPIVSSSTLLIMIMLALYYLTVVAAAFVCSFISKSSEHTASLASMSYLILWIPVRLLYDVPMNRTLTLLTGLCPHMPMYWFWKEVALLEQFGKKVDFSTMWSSHSERTGSVFLCYVLMVLQCCLMAVLVAYLSLVRVGAHGVALPWNFILQKQYWGKKVKPQKLSDATEEEPIARDPKYFEPPPRADVGIGVNNVSKMFGKERALYNVSFDVYKGEITVLLGHNGAGKTTLMSIITGMISATEGKVFLNGRDASETRRAGRNEIGLCPQHNLFFPDLTVIEHVIFFSLLKGVPYAEARKSSQQLLEQLGVGAKSNSPSNDLSGGMKRRLQLACALTGGSSILVLDEPTSGLDVETRRELWDLLLTLRGERTVLLTTHYMEEADALGDRVAALHAGQLRCHATPMHLKKNIGTGYRLSLTTIGLPNEQAITSVVTSQVPDATLKEKSLNSISYSLPASSSDRFPQLFTMLEAKRSELGVDSIGVGVSTLEEVFLRLCSDVNTVFDEDTVDAPTEEHARLTGFALCIRQMIVLMKRQYRYTMSKIVFFTIFQVAIPIALIFSVTYAFNTNGASGKQSNDSVSLDLDLYKNMPDRRVLYNLVNESYLRNVRDHNPKVDFETTSDVADAVLRTGKTDLLDYNKYLAGIEVNDNSSKVFRSGGLDTIVSSTCSYGELPTSGHRPTLGEGVWASVHHTCPTQILYTTTVRHAAPVALNILSNVLATRIGLNDDIVINNHPMETSYVPLLMDTEMKEPKNIAVCTTWSMFMVFLLLATALNAVSLPCKERISSTRHLQRLAGCSPTVAWLSTLLPHTALYMLVTAMPILIAAAIADAEHTLDQSDLIGCLFLLMFVGLLSFLAFAYLVSFCLAERGASTVLIVVVVVFGLITGPLKTGLDVFEEELAAHWNALMTYCYYVMPPHTLAAGYIKATNVARLNAYCTLNKDKCPVIFVTGMYKGFDLEKCCVTNQKPRSYFHFDMYSPLKEIIVLIVQAIVYMILVIMTQHGVMNRLYDKLNTRYRPPAPKYHDEMVRAERTYVEKCITLPNKQIPDAMLVHNVHKNYINIFRKSCNAVKGVSFSVKKGECFGVLGVNGAGKSTTFKMITGEEAATRGAIFANGHHLKTPRSPYLNSLSYCPQFFGLDDFLTGKENLQLLLTLRGLSTDDVLRETKAWIKVVGLEKYTNQTVSGYSGGCQRRLGAAAALCTGAPVTLLDEPTAGVDVSARRRVWAALRTALQQRRAIIITSHSMDEMEALCARIAIMSAGEVCALGSPSALRAAHASGHAVMLKIRSVPQGDEIDSATGGVLSLKSKLHERFNCTLKDEHVSMLHYHINETMRYSDLFAALEDLKASFPHLIEDYTVSETTLEEVFLSFAQEPRDGPVAV